MIVVGGANGSGKTTFATRYFKELGVPFLNADIIAKQLSHDGVPNAMIAAGRVFFRRLEELLVGKETFIVETTLSGSYINKIVRRAATNGFRTRLVFIFLDDPKACIERVRARVLKGGHDVPIVDIIRRYQRSNTNFRVLKLLFDEWYLYYNGQITFQAVASGDAEEVFILDSPLYNKFQVL